MTNAAKADTANNGFKDDVNGVAVTAAVVNNRYVTVTVSQPAHLMLAGLFMGSAPTISATAQAGIVYNGSPACVLVTSPNASAALGVTGGGHVQANGCAIVVNSNSSSAVTASGPSLVEAAKLCGPGGSSVSGSAQLDPALSKCLPLSDPYANCPAPPNANDPCQFGGSNGIHLTGTQTLSPGVYCGGISISAPANVTFQSGTYILRNGGITSSGSSTLQGAGVGFYLTGTNSQVNIDDVSLSGGTAVNFSAPTSGPLAGFVFFQDVDTASTGAITNTLSGSSSVKYEGTLYFGNQNVTITGSGTADGTAPFTSMIANQMTYTGSGSLVFNSNYNNSNVPPPNLKLGQVALTQ